MPKQYFWPLSMVILGVIMVLTMFGFLPMYLLWFWPVVMLLVGLVAILLADSNDWMSTTYQKPAKPTSKRRRK